MINKYISLDCKTKEGFSTMKHKNVIPVYLRRRISRSKLPIIMFFKNDRYNHLHAEQVISAKMGMTLQGALS